MTFEADWNVSLVEAVEGLDDQLRVVSKGKVVCCVGLLATFYYECEMSEARDRAIAAYERYRAAIGERLVWGADPKTGRPKQIAGVDIGDVRCWAPRVPLGEDFSFVFHGGKEKYDASPYTIRCLRTTWNRLAALSFTLPIAWIAANVAGEFVRLVADVAAILRPEHGYAGLGVIPYVNQSSKSSEMTSIVGLGRRFRGLEIDFPFSHAIYLAERPAIKGVNWLTVLAESWVNAAGGEALLRSRLSTEISFMRYAGGVVLQAGPKPLFGDVNRNEPMVPYEKVARALKTIRATDISSISSSYGMNREATTAWLNRFD